MNNKKRILRQAGWVFAILIGYGGTVMATGEVDLSISPEVEGSQEGRVPKEQPKMALNYVNQPPLIPHSIEGYQVTKNSNRCLTCHGVEHYRTTGAPRISPTHFMDGTGKVSNEVTPRRYFCLQCHVTQSDAAPIIDNTFQPAPGFGK